MTDFSGYTSGLSSPATRAVAVTPNDSTDLSFAARSLYVGIGGDVSVITVGGDTVTFPDVPSGYVLPVRVSRVRDTDTTASGIVALA